MLEIKGKVNTAICYASRKITETADCLVMSETTAVFVVLIRWALT